MPIEKFRIDFRDDDGTLFEFLYWVTNGRCFMKARINGTEHKARRISEEQYLSAYDGYMNY